MDHQVITTECDLEFMLFDETAEPKPLSFSLLERITKDFSYKMEIGRGAFAMVYKAKLEKGVVAVKRLTNTYMYEKEFFREIECLMKVKHRNIVRFLGYCVDTQGSMIMHEGKYVMADKRQRLLCFEYLPNGALNHYIKDPSCGLEWTTRYDIIKGICEGLHHLHQLNIVHLDLKPANILLDENMEPKITDFGVSRSFEENQTRLIATEVLGTLGYMAPEFVSHLLTKKYDLHSLGVIIMEILTGEKTCQCIETVLKIWSDRLAVSRRKEKCAQIRVCVDIGIECMDFDPANRPDNIEHIIQRLSETERIEVKEMAENMRSSSSPGSQVEAEWIEQFEPGVYVTLVSFHDGTKELKRIQFSRRRYGEHQACSWWNENHERVYDKYNVPMYDGFPRVYYPITKTPGGVDPKRLLELDPNNKLAELDRVLAEGREADRAMLAFMRRGGQTGQANK